MELIFLIIGISLLYLAQNNQVHKKVCVRKIRIDDKDLVVIDKYDKLYFKKFKKLKDDQYSVVIKKDSPKNLYENIRIYYGVQFLLFYKNLNPISLDDNPIKIILKYDDKDLMFYFDKPFYELITFIMRELYTVQDKVKNDPNITYLVPKNEMDLRKCNNCFFQSQCTK